MEDKKKAGFFEAGNFPTVPRMPRFSIHVLVPFLAVLVFASPAPSTATTSCTIVGGWYMSTPGLENYSTLMVYDDGEGSFMTPLLDLTGPLYL